MNWNLFCLDKQIFISLSIWNDIKRRKVPLLGIGFNPLFGEQIGGYIQGYAALQLFLDVQDRLCSQNFIIVIAYFKSSHQNNCQLLLGIGIIEFINHRADKPSDAVGFFKISSAVSSFSWLAIGSKPAPISFEAALTEIRLDTLQTKW